MTSLCLNLEKSKSSMVVRDSNIELLRIITAMGVYILHYNNPLSGKALAISGGDGNRMFTSPGSNLLQRCKSFCVNNRLL